MDAGVSLPSFADPKKFVRWLVGVHWDSADLGSLNFYTTPIALTTLLLLAPEQLAEKRAHDAIRALTNATLDVEPVGPMCFGDYPPSAFLTYWTLRGLSAALSMPGSNPSWFSLPRLKLAVTRAAEWVDSELHRQFSYYSVGDLDRFNVFEMGVATLERRPSIWKTNELGSFDLVAAMTYSGDMRITPVFVSIAAFGLCQFGLVMQDGFREFVEAVQ